MCDCSVPVQCMKQSTTFLQTAALLATAAEILYINNHRVTLDFCIADLTLSSVDDDDDGDGDDDVGDVYCSW